MAADRTGRVDRITAGEAVRTENLTKVYDGHVKALNGLNLKVGEGTVFALLGPNGAGKTTLMRILTTQIRQTSGKAYVSGNDTLTGGEAIRRLISYVPQEISVWTDITGRENLLIYAKLYDIPGSKMDNAVHEVLALMELEDRCDELVKNYSGA